MGRRSEILGCGTPAAEAAGPGTVGLRESRYGPDSAPGLGQREAAAASSAAQAQPSSHAIERPLPNRRASRQPRRDEARGCAEPGSDSTSPMATRQRTADSGLARLRACDSGTPVSEVIPIDQVADTAQDGALALTTAALGRCGQHAAGQAREGQGLQPHLAGAGEYRKEQTLAAK